MSTNIRIRRAVRSDSPRATELARAAKAHWQYPAEWLAFWHPVLVISAEMIDRYPTYVACMDDEVVGVCQLQEADGRAMLEHVWVDPRMHGHGVGRALVEHAQREAPGIMMVVADPNAVGFYLKLGARRVGEVAGPMPGAPDRTLPLLELDAAVS